MGLDVSVDELDVGHVLARKRNRFAIAVHPRQAGRGSLHQPAQPHSSAAANVDDVPGTWTLLDEVSIAELCLRRGPTQAWVSAPSAELDLNCRTRTEMGNEFAALSAAHVGWILLASGTQQAADPTTTHD
jgi:hypothetical protein